MLKNRSGKNYFTIKELQNICAALSISSEGVKHEIIERIVAQTKNSESTDSENAESSDSEYEDVEMTPPISRVCITHNVTPLPTQTPPALPPALSSQPLPIEPSNNHNETRRTMFATVREWMPTLLSVILIGLGFGNFLINWTPEYVSVPVKRTWFS